MRIIAFFSVLAVSTAEALAAPSAPRNLRVCASDLASCGSDPDPEPPPPPPATGFPDASSTGPVAGTVFQDYEGVYEVRTDGAVLNGLSVRGAIVVNANQNADAYAAFGHRVVPDAVGGFAGPLAGLHAGLAVVTTAAA